MASASDFIGGLPVGDKLRDGTVVTLPATTDNTTVLTVASGGGVLHGVFINSVGNDFRLKNVKLTIDGAAERTLMAVTGGYAVANTTSATTSFYFPLPVAFKTSLTLKISNAGTNSAFGLALYTIK
jgi:hypothetical protein